MFYGISLILLSIIAVPSLLLSKRPDAKELLEKIEPYQGWIGFVFCIFGIIGIISSIFSLNVLKSAPIWWLTLLAGSVVEAGLGFLLGYGLITKYILSKNADAKEKADELRAKITPLKGKLGMLGLIVGAWMIVAYLFFRG